MSPFGRLRRYITFTSRSDARIRREVDDELRHHLELRAAKLVQQGLAPTEARAQAEREFGDVADAARYCADVDRKSERRRRTTDGLREVSQDVALTLRMLRRAPAFTVATIVTLALAIGGAAAVYGVLDAYLVRPLPFPASDRLMSVLPGPTLEFFPRMPSLRNVEWRRADSLFAATAAWDLDGFTIPGERAAEYVNGAWVSPGFFRALGLQPAIGRGFRLDEYRDHAPVAIISHDLWVRRFGANAAAIGSTITAHSTDRPREASRVTIVGVTPRGFWPINRFNDVLRPLPEDRMPSLALLQPGASMRETQDRLDAIVRAQITGEIDPAWRMTLIPTRDEHSARVRPILVAVFGAALFMLLAACASAAGAQVSRVAVRRAELAIRGALGGSRRRIVRQLLTESAVLAVIAGALGVAIAAGLLALGAPLVERQLATVVPGGAATLRIDGSIVVMTIAASLVAGVVVGIVPAASFLRTDQTALIGASRGTSGRAGGARVRRILIAGQITIAMTLLFGAGLMVRTVARIAGADLGFEPDGVTKGTMLFPLTRYPDSTARRQAMERVLANVGRTAGVRSVAAVFPHPFRGVEARPLVLEGSAVADARAGVYTVSPGYFETMKIRLLGGRTIGALDDQSAPLVVVVSEDLARRLSIDGSLIGRRVRVGDTTEPWRTVVGVVNATKKGFDPETTPDVYLPYAQNPRAYQSIVVRGDAPTLVDDVRRAVAAVDPVLALSEIETMTDVVAGQGAQRRGMTALLGAFAVFALALSALALYASLSYTVTQRRAELAIRLAVGANPRAILRLVVRDGLATAAFGVAAGVLASLAMARVLEQQVYGVAVHDPATLVAIALVLACAAVMSCFVPGVRAARTDPALALRD